MDVAELFHLSPRRCIKWSSYFQVYEELFQHFRGKAVTVVEVGILDGGSLFMWREFLGPQARIVGIDMNPRCRELEKDGFEVFIGDQSRLDFWSDFYAKVGEIDVLVDDGGHTNLNQLATLLASLDHVRDGGVILVEDVHTSYIHRFGNPHRYSFISRCKQAIDEINARNPLVNKRPTAFTGSVYSITFYESIVAFHVNRRLCVTSKSVENEGLPINAENHEPVDNKSIAQKNIDSLARIPRIKDLAARAYTVLRSARVYARFRLENSRLGRYFG
jgi:hypothetical protein